MKAIKMLWLTAGVMWMIPLGFASCTQFSQVQTERTCAELLKNTVVNPPKRVIRARTACLKVEALSIAEDAGISGK